MFHRTLIRLTATNSVVVGVLFLLFSISIYSYVAFRLFDQVDDAMRQKASGFQIRNGRPVLSPIRPALFDPRTILLLRGSDGRLVNLYSNIVDDPGTFLELAEHAETGKLTGRKLGIHTYRLYSTPYQYGDAVLNRPGLPPVFVQEVIAISIVDSEVALLKRLLLILLIGLVGGMLIIIMAGYLLARRALSPVRVAWERQQQFVADASHELRTPLAVIKSNAELTLRHPNHTIEEESIRITNVIRETIRMNKLVSSLLTLAQSDADKTSLHLAPIHLQSMIEAVVEQFRPMAESKNIAVVVAMPKDIVLIGDRERLHQMLVILLDNAIKYTACGRVAVSCTLQTSTIILTVSDSGCGIAADDLPRIFDRFYRGDKARSRESGGAGLGLSIAKWIVEAHGGKIQAVSEAGCGTEITITIPQTSKGK